MPRIGRDVTGERVTVVRLADGTEGRMLTRVDPNHRRGSSIKSRVGCEPNPILTGGNIVDCYFGK